MVYTCAVVLSIVVPKRQTADAKEIATEIPMVSPLFVQLALPARQAQKSTPAGTVQIP